MTEHDWTRYANCLGADPDLFFPERGDMLAIQQAKAICRGCSVLASCLDANLHERHGVWGGLTERERRRERRRRAVNRAVGA